MSNSREIKSLWKQFEENESDGAGSEEKRKRSDEGYNSDFKLASDSSTLSCGKLLLSTLKYFMFVLLLVLNREFLFGFCASRMKWNMKQIILQGGDKRTHTTGHTFFKNSPIFPVYFLTLFLFIL